jgi:CheY-like chemotaxis protein
MQGIQQNIYSVEFSANPEADHVAQPDFQNAIVVVDDDADDRNAVVDLFKKIDPLQKFVFFKNGEAFIRHVKSYDPFWEDEAQIPLPRMVILDMHMPVKDGIQTLEVLKSSLLWKGIPVILVTGTDDDQKIQQAFDLGANAFLSKPFNKMDFFCTVYRGFNFSSSAI